MTIEEDFNKWITEHPEIENHFIELALSAKRVGRRKIGAKAIFEAMRWSRMIQGNTISLPNNYTALMARRAMEIEPRLKGMFVTARLRHLYER